MFKMFFIGYEFNKFSKIHLMTVYLTIYRL
jgi:hypothetical protein